MSSCPTINILDPLFIFPLFPTLLSNHCLNRFYNILDPGIELVFQYIAARSWYVRKGNSRRRLLKKVKSFFSDPRKNFSAKPAVLPAQVSDNKLACLFNRL